MPRFRLPSLPALAAILPCLLASPGPLRADDISHKALRDIRIAIQFETGTGYSGNVPAQEEFRRGAHMAMRMWQSILPSMHVTWVVNPADANLTFMVGNYHNISKGTCGPGGGPDVPLGWSGCSFNPSNGEIAGQKIYFNTRAQPGTQYIYDRFNRFSRQELYNSYVPATYPPIGYGYEEFGWTGFINGQFTAELGGEDATWIVFHEFGHSLNYNHQLVDPLPFYGIPRPRTGPVPTTPNIFQTSSAYPLLPPQYYGGGTKDDTWLGDIKPIAVKLHQMADYVGKVQDANGDPLQGLPSPMLNKFNFRVVSPDLLADMPPGLKEKARYPLSTGTVRLERGDGSVRLENQWTKAYEAAQLNQVTQSNPYFVSGVYPHGQTQKLAVGAFHSLGIRDDGSLWAWGRNDKGQLGDNSTINRSTPVPIGSVKTWVAVAVGDGFSLALRSDNTLWAWGDRTYGQVGDGIFSGTPVLQPKQIGGNEWVVVKAGPLHALALKTDGSLWGWGYNGFGNLGTGDNSNVAAPTPAYCPPNMVCKDWVSLAAGTGHTLAGKADGSLWTWGWNDFGTLGNGNTISSSRPEKEVRAKPDWTMIDAGHEHSIALDAYGKVWTWGRNQFLQLGAASTVAQDPYPVARIPFTPYASTATYMKVAAGHWHSAVIKKNGSLWSWGWNSKGQLGANQTLNGKTSSLVQEATASARWTDVYAGQEYTLAERDDRSFWAWGDNTYGQLGTGSSGTTPVNAPVPSKWQAFIPSLNLFWAVGEAGTDGKLYMLLNARVSRGAKRVEFFVGTTRVDACTQTAPPEGDVQCRISRPVGVYSVSATMVDQLEKQYKSTPQTVYLHMIKLVASAAAAPITKDLTAEGTIGWKHFYGPNSRSGGPAIGLAMVQDGSSRVTTPRPAFSWTNGTPTASGNSTGMVAYMDPAGGDGFNITLPPSSTLRKARLYFVGRNMNMSFGAVAGDFQVYHVWNNNNGSINPVYYEVHYQTAGNMPLEVYGHGHMQHAEPQWFGVQAVTLFP